MALDNLFVLDFCQVFVSKDIHNIFTYEGEVGGTAANLADAFIEDVVPDINAFQMDEIKNVSVTVTNLGDLGDNSFMTVAGAGALTDGDMLPLFNAVNFTLKTANRAVRPGSKRFSGLSEASQAGGRINSPDVIALLETMRGTLIAPIEAEAGFSFNPVVIKRVKYVVPDSDPVRYAYRFPEIGETPVYSILGGVLVNLDVSHQTSR